MPVPASLRSWLDTHYPSPRVDEEWLDGCYDYVTATHNLDPAHHLDAIIEQVQSQLLQSDLTDSMAHGTGIPLGLLSAQQGKLRGPVLVEITAITEIGASALSLDTVRQAREERIAAGAGGEEGEEEADLEVDGEGPVPNYPRSMLRFELSDGASTLSAFEYRTIPELTLGVTPLGYKMVLRDVLIRRGMAFLEPKCIEIKGHRTEDREVLQKSDFARGLRRRLGRPDIDPEPAPAPAPAPQPAQVQVQAQEPPPAPPPVRSPLREISPSPPPEMPVDTHQHDDDENQQPRRRKVPTNVSPYFSSSSNPPPMGLSLSPTRNTNRGTFEIQDSDSDNENENENAPAHPPGLPSRRPIVPLKASARKQQPAPASDDDYGDIDMDMDDAFLAELQKAEDASLAQTRSSAGPSGGGGADVITIDDDEDEEMEDKENVPAPQRHVRRKVFGDVIDISDSDD
ncbi:DUF1767 domain-containing protein [Mycena chlorophos]|uniref:RecQ-mediated genome instability protein 1 n=1 Tax=Mycena chlorophos TaxID=658473 RepID=A0A8H6THA4_MYCCL|nr:DUF1767 domain-containing protein [Mycena chlorophos]